MFKKPKRNFRSRRRDSESGDEENGGNNEQNPMDGEESMEQSMEPIVIPAKKLKKKKDKDKPIEKSSSVLSFEHYEEDHQEEFKIKKSSHSRKVAKQLKKQHQKEKEERERLEREQQQQKAQDYTAENIQALKDAQEAANGDVLERDGTISENIEEEEQGDGKFNKSRDFTSVGMGIIPDAATIHAIRKKRQMAREQGDYIPLDDTQKVTTENDQSRLVRDDDNDKSDSDEDDAGMSFSVDQRDDRLRKIQQQVLQAREEDNSGSDHDWEEQQIRKGVQAAIAPLPSSDDFFQVPTSYGYGGSYSNGNYGYSNQVTDMDVDDLGNSTSRKVPPAELPKITMESIVKKLSDRLTDAMDIHVAHVHERDDTATRFMQTLEDIENADGKRASLEEQYRFFQEMRGYVQDLVECLNHKFPAIEHLEKSMFKQYQKRAEKFVKRRQQDIQDESSDALKMKTSAVDPNQDPAKQRRIAEREARRTRRRRKRQIVHIQDHEEGMSTDDELNPSELSTYNTERERITQESEHLFEDVVEDFWQFHPIMNQFEKWRDQHTESYEEAYIGLCLPKLFTPLIRLKLVTWNPLEKNCPDFEETSWFESLMFYGHKEGIKQDIKDADLKLMPSIIEKVLLPKLTGFVENVWDPMSSSETKRLVSLVKRLIRDYPPVGADSKNTKILVKAIVDRMRKTLDDDVFMPLYPKLIMESNRNAASFFKRQFWQSFKLLRNMLSWSDVVAEKPLQELALDGLLNRYILLGMQNSAVDICMCQEISSMLPRDWFSGLKADATIPQLAPLARYLMFAANSYGTSAMGLKDLERKDGRDKIKQISKLLINIHAVTDALSLADKYSFKLHQL